jgi:hypothetical protein
MIRIYTFLLALLTTLALTAQTNPAYIRLADQTGFMPTQAQLDTLEVAAQALRAAFPDTNHRRDFAVYDFGFYLHSEQTTGGYPEAFQMAIDSVKQIRPYYLLFGRQSTVDGVNGKFWVDLKLPSDGVFACFKQSRKSILINQALFKLNGDGSLTTNTTNPMAVFKEIIVESAVYIANELECCNSNQNKERPGCNLCPSKVVMKQTFLGYGFVGTKVDHKSTAYAGVSGPKYLDFSSTSLSNDALFSKLIELWQGYGSNQDTFFVTDDYNFCPISTDFDFVLKEYSKDLTDYDIWVHYHYSDDGVIMFVNSERYLLVDNDAYTPYFDQGLVTAKPGEVSQKQALKFAVFSEDMRSAYFADTPIIIYELPTVTNISQYLPDHPTYSVLLNDNYYTIAAQSNGLYTVTDLIRWNPSTNPDNLQIGTKLLLFSEDYGELLFNEYSYVPLQFPIDGLSASIHQYPLSSKDVFEYLNPQNNPNVGYVPTPKPQFVRPVLPTLPFEPIPVTPPTPPPLTTTTTIEALKWVGRGLLTVGEIALLVVLSPTTLNAPAPVYSPFIYDEPKPYDPRYQLSDKEWIYVTYTKTNLKASQVYTAPGFTTKKKAGRIYAGRSRGKLSPDIIVSIRDKGHKVLNEDDFGKACLDKAFVSTKPFEVRRSDPSYRAIRGREQIIIEKHGGTIFENLYSLSHRYAMEKGTRSRNLINGIAKNNDIYAPCMALQLKILPVPTKNWDGVCPFP